MTPPGADSIDLEAQLQRGLDELDLALDATRRSQLVELSLLVEQGNARRNLTGHPDSASILQRLVLDALGLWQALEAESTGGPIVDLGSGSGFPGIPVAILAPERRVILVDGRERRYHFQRHVQRALRLDNLEPRLGRIEALEPEPGDLVLAQALAKPVAALDYALRWVAVGGRIAIPGTEVPPDPGPHPRLSAVGIARYRVPLDGPSRTVWWGRASAP